MSQIKTQGLIIKACNLNDNDKIFTILTRDSGIITAVSKGIRSQKHKDFSALQLFCYSNLVVQLRTGLSYISSADVINNFFDIRSSVEKVALAAYIADIANAAPNDEGYEEPFFNFVLNTLYMIGKIKNDADLKHNIMRLKTIFELKYCCEMGYQPYVKQCKFCGSHKNAKYFDTYEGGIICEDCEQKASVGKLININEKAAQMLEYICESDLKSVFKFNADTAYISELNNISEVYLQCQMEIAPPTLEYLKNLIIKPK